MRDDMPPIAIVKPHWYPEGRRTVLRVTATQIIVGARRKDGAIVESRYRRKDGFPPGAFANRHSMTPDHLVNYADIDAWAEANGGTWKRPKVKP